MKTRILQLLLMLLGHLTLAQHHPYYIQASSTKVNARLGDYFLENAFTIQPDSQDTLGLNLPSDHDLLTFYTDHDSISFVYNPIIRPVFGIILDGEDTSYFKIKYPDIDVNYLDTLKLSGGYDNMDDSPLNHISYLPSNGPKLVLIKQKYKLDSIAGTGNEISQLINILAWVHNTFIHNGSLEVPPNNGIDELMDKCSAGAGTMHCGALSWTLNSCYAALGYKSRQVMCMPKDSTDMESHSINAVYSNTLEKWLWMDPTNFAYVMDDKGTLLSISEVRDKLLKDETLILNPDANWNRRTSIVKEEYLYRYMAKNLYAIQCWSDDWGNSKSNVLLPINHDGVYSRTKENNPKQTTNALLFWGNPN